MNDDNQTKVIQTEGYIRDHAAIVHSYESIGRTFAHAALMSAAALVREQGPNDEIELDIKVRITPMAETKCELICIYFPLLNETHCIHTDITTP